MLLCLFLNSFASSRLDEFRRWMIYFIFDVVSEVVVVGWFVGCCIVVVFVVRGATFIIIVGFFKISGSWYEVRNRIVIVIIILSVAFDWCLVV